MSDAPILSDAFRVDHALGMHLRGELYPGQGPKRPISLVCEALVQARQVITQQHSRLCAQHEHIKLLESRLADWLKDVPVANEPSA